MKTGGAVDCAGDGRAVSGGAAIAIVCGNDGRGAAIPMKRMAAIPARLSFSKASELCTPIVVPIVVLPGRYRCATEALALLRQRDGLQIEWPGGCAWSIRCASELAGEDQSARVVELREMLHALKFRHRVVRHARDVGGWVGNFGRVDGAVGLEVIGLELHDAARGVGDQDVVMAVLFVGD